MSIPNIFHFILISKDGKTAPELEYFQYVSIKSAWLTNNPEKIFLYITIDPTGPYLERLVSEIPNLELTRIDDFTEFMGNPVPYFTHKTDIIRLQKLIEFGGVYLDLDTITLKNLQIFRRYSKFVTCLEDDSWRLGSAVLLAEKGSEFAKKCLEFYKDFRSTGRDEYFVEIVQEKPYELWLNSYKGSNVVTITKADYILSPKTLLDFKGNAVYFKKFFEEDNFHLNDSYVVHLWTELNYQRYIKVLDQVLSSETTFSKLIKRFLD